ncbi:MAG: SUMF1/EgtB/PvdO family nonheme iron enzyme, partial [Planctomycetota bacterium]
MQWVSKVSSYTWGLIAAVLCLAYGAIASNFLACVLALALVIIFGKQAWEARQSRPKAATTTDDSSSPAEKPKRRRRKKKRKKASSNGNVATPKDYISKMIGQGRYAILLRDEVSESIDDSSVEQARAELNHMMSIVKGGDVLQKAGHPSDQMASGDRAVSTTPVEEFYIDRFAVTNEEFKRFVDDEGYKADEYWAEEIRFVRDQFT